LTGAAGILYSAPTGRRRTGRGGSPVKAGLTEARGMKDRRREGSQYSGLRTSGVLLSIPTLLIVAPLVGFFGGFWLDRWLGTSPWFGILGLVLGFVAAGRETYVIYRRYLAEEERDKRQGK
jgi:ATP synthase protein I